MSGNTYPNLSVYCHLFILKFYLVGQWDLETFWAELWRSDSAEDPV